MVQALRMPMLGNTMETGVLQEWVVGEGESVEAGEVVAVVESEKAVADVTAAQAGVLARVDVAVGEEVPPGTVIGVILGPDESLDDAPAPRSHREPTVGEGGNAGEETAERDAGASGGEAAERVGQGETEPVDATGEAGATGTTAVRAAPGARKLAAERGLDLASVDGTGPDGAVLRADVEEHVTARDESDDGPGIGGSSGARDHRRASPSTRRLARELGVPLDGVAATGIGGRITDTDVRAAAGTLEGWDATTPAAGGSGTDGSTRAGDIGGPPASDPDRLGVTVTGERELVGTRRTIAERMARSAREAPHVTLEREVSVGRALSVVDELADARDAPVGFTDLVVGAAVRALGEHPEVNAWFEAGRLRLVGEVNVAVAVDTDAGLVAPVVRDADARSLGDIARTRRELTESVLAGEHTTDDLRGGTFTVSNLGMFGVDSFDPIINPPQVAILGVGRIRERNGERACTLSLSFDHRVLDGADAARFLGTLVDGVESPWLVVADRAAASGESERKPRAAGVPTDDTDDTGLDDLARAVARDLERRAREVADAHGWPVPAFEVELGGGRPVVTVAGGEDDIDSRATLRRLAYAACRESAFADTVVGLRDPELRVA